MLFSACVIVSRGLGQELLRFHGPRIYTQNNILKARGGAIDQLREYSRAPVKN